MSACLACCVLIDCLILKGREQRKHAACSEWLTPDWVWKALCENSDVWNAHPLPIIRMIIMAVVNIYLSCPSFNKYYGLPTQWYGLDFSSSAFCCCPIRNAIDRYIIGSSLTTKCVLNFQTCAPSLIVKIFCTPPISHSSPCTYFPPHIPQVSY